jgi:hypothetical protein
LPSNQPPPLSISISAAIAAGLAALSLSGCLDSLCAAIASASASIALTHRGAGGAQQLPRVGAQGYTLVALVHHGSSPPCLRHCGQLCTVVDPLARPATLITHPPPSVCVLRRRSAAAHRHREPLVVAAVEAVCPVAYMRSGVPIALCHHRAAAVMPPLSARPRSATVYSASRGGPPSLAV